MVFVKRTAVIVCGQLVRFLGMFAAYTPCPMPYAGDKTVVLSRTFFGGVQVNPSIPRMFVETAPLRGRASNHNFWGSGWGGGGGGGA